MAKRSTTTPDPAPGVAVRVEETEARYADGVPVSAPSDPEQTGSGSKSGQQAAPDKEK